ncbi:hypothetical protein [Oceanidesulfovibrio marinus]|uniref:Uncharacterized protein n=1 Tax=Oceanidesulfovibrio marinus TaxID=370038 RepID=A0A6P1ZCC2_9BACT|nr:hypothetical protein [Oceanidesulfovibrio marinus]QJT10424.1 hypothetical protein E8L03_16445 [Oceanidesulfovibrio marinus]TVM30670.1 hypothetical protein DQK91_20105 [Oceanidesulfovibrio marinus]
MPQENQTRIIMSLRDGTVVKGQVNLKVYSPMGRLSDGLNRAEDFIVLTDYIFLYPPNHCAEEIANKEALFINRMQIVWATPLD